MAVFNSTNVTNILGSDQFANSTLEEQAQIIATYGYNTQIEGVRQTQNAANLQRKSIYDSTTEQLQASQFNIDSAKNNAAIAVQNQKFVKELTDENVRRIREANKAQVSSVRAKLAANGVVVDTGSPLDIALEQAKQGELKAEDQILAGNVQIRAYDLQAQQYLREAGRNQQNQKNIISAYDNSMNSTELGLQASQIMAVPSLLQSFQTMNGAGANTNSLKSLLGY